MTRRQGKVAVGSIAYAPQDPWYATHWLVMLFVNILLVRILSATVRENITFFHEFDEDFYSLVLEGIPISYPLSYDTYTHLVSSLCTHARLGFIAQRRHDGSRRKRYEFIVQGARLLKEKSNSIGITVWVVLFMTNLQLKNS